MNKRKPFIVELTGTPESGKTSVKNMLEKQLRELGYIVEVYEQSSEKTPKIFPQRCFEENLWKSFNTAKNVLEAPFMSHCDIVILDGGSIDSLFWIYLDSVNNPQIAFKTVPLGKIFMEYPPNLLFALQVSETEAIRRRGGEGWFIAKDFISTYNRLFQIFIHSIKTNKIIIDTDDKQIEEVVKIIKNSILEQMISHS